MVPRSCRLDLSLRIAWVVAHLVRGKKIHPAWRMQISLLVLLVVVLLQVGAEGVIDQAVCGKLVAPALRFGGVRSSSYTDGVRERAVHWRD